MTAVRVVLVDSNHLFRSGLGELLRSDEAVDVAAEGASGDDALRLVRQFRPNVLVLDIAAPHQEATSTIRNVRRLSPSTGIVILTMLDDADLVRDAMAAGAAGYVLKTAHLSEVTAAISMVARADASVMVAISRPALTQLMQAPKVEGEALSPREWQVLSMLAKGKKNQEIGFALRISAATVKRHLTHIYRKLGASSRLDAVLKADTAGILDHA